MVVVKGLGINEGYNMHTHTHRSIMFRWNYMLKHVVQMTAVPGGQRFSNEDFIETSDGEETGLGETFCKCSCP